MGMTEWDEEDWESWHEEQDDHALSPRGIAEENQQLLRRYREFRRAADVVVTALQERSEIVALALIGSLAIAPWKEVPRFAPYRRARVQLWHQCKDVDLAAWVEDLDDLNGLRRAKDLALRDLQEEVGFGVASHQVEVFLFEPGTDRHLGRLCRFNRCPKGKAECLVPGCGDIAFLRQLEGFRWRPDSLAEDRIIRLFDRSRGRFAFAIDLPLPGERQTESLDV